MIFFFPSLLPCICASSPHRGTEMMTFFNKQDSWGRSVHLSSWVYHHYPLPQGYLHHHKVWEIGPLLGTGFESGCLYSSGFQIEGQCLHSWSSSVTTKIILSWITCWASGLVIWTQSKSNENSLPATNKVMKKYVFHTDEQSINPSLHSFPECLQKPDICERMCRKIVLVFAQSKHYPIALSLRIFSIYNCGVLHGERC